MADMSYEQACHAMQSGVAMMMNYDPRSTEPKHLRVGVNSAMVNNAAIARLLMDKGIITMEEYEEANRLEMNLEVERYKERIKQHLGTDAEVKLG